MPGYGVELCFANSLLPNLSEYVTRLVIRPEIQGYKVDMFPPHPTLPMNLTLLHQIESKLIICCFTTFI